MLKNLTNIIRAKLLNIAGNEIDPASDSKLNELKTALENIYGAVDDLELTTENIKIESEQINLNTDELEAKVQSVRDQLNVLLSTRASEETTQSMLNALGTESGNDLLSQLKLISSGLTDVASETTLVQVRDYLDTVEIKLQSLIDKLDVDLSTRASENTLTEVRDTIGQESGSTVLSKLGDLWDKLTSLFTDGLAKVKFWDGTNIALITSSGRVKIDTSPPDAPAETIPVVITEYSLVATVSDNVYIIPNGETLVIQRFVGGAETDSTAGNVVELWYDPNGTGIGMAIIDTIFCSGSGDQHDLRETFLGDGVKSIRMRRKRYSGGSKEIFGRWEGYY